uniref:Reverse transcriptase domain-containing protein n=1 Tax=Ananas comosus var. bracteatus TaxID=296719 RepID=A0A6V7QHM7_ANACO|nr:unnamed protein product [Ananas comosus var. bracteatus]
MPADLLVLGQLQDFDVVLGMDWLARYYTTIDCGARTVTFRELGQEEFTFRGGRSTLFATWISSARSRQLMSKGCIAFLATVVEEEKKKKKEKKKKERKKKKKKKKKEREGEEEEGKEEEGGEEDQEEGQTHRTVA